MSDTAFKKATVELPTTGWIRLSVEEAVRYGRTISPGDPVPEGVRGWTAPGDDKVDFVLIDAADCWPTLWLHKRAENEYVELSGQAAALALHYASGEPLKLPSAQQVVNVYFHMPEEGWSEAPPDLLARVQAIVGAHVQGTDIRCFAVDVPGKPGAVYYVLTGVGPNLPFLALIAPQLQGKAMIAPRDMALVAERCALGRPALPPTPVLSDGFDGQPEVLRALSADVPTTPSGETIH